MSSQRWLLSIFAFLLLAASALVLAFFLVVHIVTRPDFPAKAGDPSLVAQEQAFLMHDQNCQVLIYGDSTASVGIDPLAITSSTGLTACNIAATRPIVDALGTEPVDAFLAHNPRPKYLILQFGPEAFYRNPSWEHFGPYAPIIMLLRDSPRNEAIHTLLRHIPDVTKFVLSMLIDPLTHHKDKVTMRRAYDRAVFDLHKNNGKLSLYLPPNTRCLGAPEPLAGRLDQVWPKQLRQKYEALGISVIISASPTMDCEPNLALFQHDLGPLVDSNTYTMPYSLFMGARHPVNEGAHMEGLLFGKMIRAREQVLAVPAHP